VPNGSCPDSKLGCARALRRLALASLTVALIGVLAALPTAASASTPSQEASAAVLVEGQLSALTPEAVQELLAGVPVGEAGVPAGELDPGKLAEALAKLPGIEELSGLGGLGGTSGLEAALREALEGLLAGPTTLGELLSAETLAGPLVERLEAALGVPVRPLIEGLLGEEPQEVLEGGLGSLDLSELLAKLLGSAENPSQLLDKLLEALNPATLESLLGTLPTGEAPKNLNVGELAGSLSQTPEALAEALGQAAGPLPATAAAVTRALEDGNELAALDGAEGLALALISRAGEGVGGTGGSSAGGVPGAGGSGGAPGSTTVIVASPAASASAAGARPASVGKVRILSRKVKGKRATIVVQVPAAGRLTLSGNGIKKVSREAAKAERMTLSTTLTPARSASLRKHRRKQTTVTLTAAFAPVGAAASKATTRVALR